VLRFTAIRADHSDLARSDGWHVGVRNAYSSPPRASTCCRANTPTPPPRPSPHGLPRFSHDDREGGLGGRIGNRKSAMPRHTTCRGGRPLVGARYSALLGVYGLKGSRLQRLGSRTGFRTGMRIAPRRGQKRRVLGERVERRLGRIRGGEFKRVERGMESGGRSICRWWTPRATWRASEAHGVTSNNIPLFMR
jgi:hypothetical protein